MGNFNRAAKTAMPRAETTPRTKSTKEQSNETSAPKRGALRRGTESGPGPDKRPLRAGDDGVLDEWLEPDQDEDLDQWLHEHGAEGDADDSGR